MSSSLRRVVSQIVTKPRHYVSVVRDFRMYSSKEESNILTSAYKKLSLLNCSVNEFLWMNLDKWPDKTALVCGITGREYTYAQTHRLSMTFAASLVSKLKLQPDDTVAIVLPNVPEYPCVMLGILQAGCIASTVNPVYTSHEIKRQLEMLNCKAIVASKLSHKSIVEALNEMKRNIPLILIENEDLPGGTIKFADLAQDFSVDTSCLKSINRSPDDVAIIPFSSGTTGLPKGVVLTHRNIVSINQMISDPDIVAVGETTDTHQAVLPAVLPFFHIFGMCVLMLNQMFLGCKLVTLPTFKPEVFLKVLVEHKATALFLVPPMAVFLGKHPAVTPQHIATLENIVCGAAPLSQSDVEAILKKNSKLVVRQGFGLTETSGAFCIGPRGDRRHAAVGKLFSHCEVKLADARGRALPAGEEGEIWFRGPNLMKGYLNNEEANREVFTDDGWFKTGDIGRYDESKYLYVTDRLKELIKVKGFQVPPAELEAILRSHPEVLDCAIIGAPDPVCGEVPYAFVVPQPGRSPDGDELKEHVNAKVTSYKKIQSLQFVQAIPKNAAGKILRKDLKQML